jgi:hypothetical protein
LAFAGRQRHGGSHRRLHSTALRCLLPVVIHKHRPLIPVARKGCIEPDFRQRLNQEPSMPKSKTSVVPIGPKVCKPFLLDVMVFSPEAGYKFKVMTERSCTPDADALWKLVFDLYQIKNEKEVQLVHVSYTTGTPVEQKAVQAMATEGVNSDQADILINRVFPATKAITAEATPAQKQEVHEAMQAVVNVAV